MTSPETAQSAPPRRRPLRPGLALAVAGVLAAGIGSACAMTPALRATGADAAAPAAASAPATAAVPAKAAAPAAAAPAAKTPAAARPLYPLPAPATYPTGCPIHQPPPGYGVIPRPPAPKVAEARVPAPVQQPLRTVDTTAASGTGIWSAFFPGDRFTATANDLVTHAVRGHLTSIWIRTGSTHDGFYGQKQLALLLPLAHARGIKVIAWDFPTLSDPAADAKRLVATLNLTVAGQQVDGVSPDVETKSEGVFLTGRRVAAYFSRVSAGAGSRPVIATVLRPTDYWWSGNYPYKSEAPYVDVFAPMIYWSCQEPGSATAQAVTRLRTLGKPVNAIGQAYDEGEYGRRGLPSPKEIWRFLDVAKNKGAVGASLYLYESMRGPLWQAMADYPWAAKTS